VEFRRETDCRDSVRSDRQGQTISRLVIEIYVPYLTLRDRLRLSQAIRGSDQNLPVLEEESPVYIHFSTLSEVANHIPMDGGLIFAS